MSKEEQAALTFGDAIVELKKVIKLLVKVGMVK